MCLELYYCFKYFMVLKINAFLINFSLYISKEYNWLCISNKLFFVFLFFLKQIYEIMCYKL